MRKAALYGLALVCVCLLFALSGPEAQKMMTGDGNGTTSSPVPVAVSNFPQIQPVAVDKTVTVTGSVAVTNFPAVQQVAGTVNVGNLPVDADGNVKVASSSCQGHRSLFVKVTDALPIGVAQASGTDVYDVTGWTNVQVFFRVSFPVGNFQTCLSLTPAFGQGDIFAPAGWSGPQACYPGGGNGGLITGNVMGGPVVGPELKFLMGGSSLTATTLEIWLYLTD
jgi:hypothetical protein